MAARSAPLRANPPRGGPQLLQLSADSVDAAAEARRSSDSNVPAVTLQPASSAALRRNSDGGLTGSSNGSGSSFSGTAISGGYVDIEQARGAVPAVDSSASVWRPHAALQHSASSPAAMLPASAVHDGSCEIDLTNVKFYDDVGEGCFGKVYRIVLWEKDVAVKVLKDQYNSQLRSEIENEVAVLKCVHPSRLYVCVC